MNEQLETYVAGAADLQVDLDEDARGIVDQGVVLGAVHPECDVNERRFIVVGGGAHTVSRQTLVKLISGALTVVIGEQQPIEKTKNLVISRIADELNYCNKQPRKTAQWKNEQRRFRK